MQQACQKDGVSEAIHVRSGPSGPWREGNVLATEDTCSWSTPRDAVIKGSPRVLGCARAVNDLLALESLALSLAGDAPYYNCWGGGGNVRTLTCIDAGQEPVLALALVEGGFQGWSWWLGKKRTVYGAR